MVVAIIIAVIIGIEITSGEREGGDRFSEAHFCVRSASS